MHPLFATSSSDYKKYLNIKNYKKDDIVFTEGEVCNSIGLVLKGAIQISTYTILENEFSISTILKDDIFASTLLFSSSPTYLGNGYCLKETEIAFISKNNFLKMLQEDKGILEAYLNFLADKRLLVQERLKILCQKNIREKILFLIQSRKGVAYTISFGTKEKLAAFLNVTRPSLSRELIKMKNDGLITYNNKTITLIKG